MRVSLLVMMLVLLFSALSTDKPIRPGDTIVNTGQIPLGTDSLLILFPQGDQLVIGGSFVMRTQLTGTDGAYFFNRAEFIIAEDGRVVHIDSFVVARSSLLPLYHRAQGLEGEKRIEFAEQVAPAFYVNSMDLVLASLPLTQGYQAQVVLSDGQLEWIALIHVVEQVTVASVTGEGCRTWKIEVESGENSGEYWLSMRGRRLVRYVPKGQDLMLLRLRGCPEDV